MKAETPVAVRPEPELHLLLLEEQVVDTRPRLLRAGTGSVVVHILIGIGLFVIAQLPAPAPPSRRAVEEFKKAVSLVAPPRELTQKEPNRTKVPKELALENLVAKPDVRPTPKTFVRPPSIPAPPAPKTPVLEAPPVIAQAAPPALGTTPLPQPVPVPPQIKPAEEKPKLTFETPGGSSGSHPATATGTGRIPLPKAGVEDAIRGAIRSGPGGVSVGDNTDEPNLANPAMQQPGSTGRPASSLELLSDPMGVDFKPYLIRVLAAVRRNWFAVIPESARMGRRGRTVVQFAISRDGKVPKLVIVTPSGADALDRAAVAGISASNPFPPLPGEFKGEVIRVQFVFSYNLNR